MRFVATEFGGQVLVHLGFQHSAKAELIAQLTRILVFAFHQAFVGAMEDLVIARGGGSNNRLFVVNLGLAVGHPLQDGGLEGLDPAQPPGQRGDAVGQFRLVGCRRRELVEDVFSQHLKDSRVFPVEQHLFGRQAVARGIAAADRLACVASRAGARQGVASVGFN